MKDQIIKLQTGVKPELLQSNLAYPLKVIIVGLILFTMAHLFISKPAIHYISPLIAIVWIIVEISAFQPYFLLRKLQQRPEELILKDQVMIYRGRRILYENLKHIHYFDKGLNYGIQLDFENGTSQKLPFFTKPSFDILKEHLLKPRYEEGPPLQTFNKF